ncbi:hypothetical protein [Spirosoma arcticum]
MFSLVLAVAAIVNTRALLDTPWSYQTYADYAILLYSRFILGPFDTIIQPLVLSIVVEQVFIAVSMFAKEFWFGEGCFFGFIFCVVIAPPGLGAAFPATLLMGGAFYQLYKHENRMIVGEVLGQSHHPLALD